jgi:hypothetical protein
LRRDPWNFSNHSTKALGRRSKRNREKTAVFRQRGPPVARSEGRRSSRGSSGLNGLLVEGGDGRKGGSRGEPEAAAEGSTMTVMLRWPTSAKDLRISSSELNAGERRETGVVH